MMVQNWFGKQVRFVEKDGDIWAVAKDILEVLSISENRHALKQVKSSDKGVYSIHTPGGNQSMVIVNELGIYRLVFQSRKEEAVKFQEWVFEYLKKIRKAIGLSVLSIYRMMSAEGQKTMDSTLHNGLKNPTKIDHIKANTITDKAVSNMFGYPKMLKKSDMQGEMLHIRGAILEDTVELMLLKDKWDLPISVSEVVYSKYRRQI